MSNPRSKPRAPRAHGERRRRLPAAEREAQLLAVAARLVGEAGVRGLTMERLAEQAGVSKGLGYAYFRDAEEVALALWDREVAELYRNVEAATTAGRSFDERLALAIRAYFDVVAARGALLGHLQAHLNRARIERRGRARLRAFVEFWSRQLTSDFPLDARAAAPTAGMMLAAADVAARAWQAGQLSRDDAERLCIAFLRGGALGASALADPNPLAARSARARSRAHPEETSACP